MPHGHRCQSRPAARPAWRAALGDRDQAIEGAGTEQGFSLGVADTGASRACVVHSADDDYPLRAGLMALPLLDPMRELAAPAAR
jgi:hypothetical protein